MIVNNRVDLSVPFGEKDAAKAQGARWDMDRKVWFAPPGTNLQSLQKWLPRDFALAAPVAPAVSSQPEKGMALVELLAKAREAIERGLPQAVWVRAEINELRVSSGNHYLKLAERDAQGNVQAQCAGIIWKSKALGIDERFRQVTGDGLRSDIKILFLAKARFEVRFGFDLIIEDVDPSFTLGDLAAKLARIRERLQREQYYERNRQLPTPTEFVRVAVISPSVSAGLGDFRQETDRLQAAGLCRFFYHQATFQGVDAPASIRNAVSQVLAAHQEQRFDALVIIRGGGAVTDLAWLNDLELARLLCASPIPLFTGIGHERDNTILDEIAHRRFDTPSKVALHLSATIHDNAVAAMNAVEQIRVQVGRILSRERIALAAQHEKVVTGAHTMLVRAGEGQDAHSNRIATACQFQLREATQSLRSQRERLEAESDSVLSDAAVRSDRLSESITQQAMLAIQAEAAAIHHLAQSVQVRTESALDATARNLGVRAASIRDQAGTMVARAEEAVDNARVAFKTRSDATLEQAARDVQQLGRMVLGLGPASTLQRGFAIARDDDNRPISSREAAMQCAAFEVEFRDGRVRVDNREYAKEQIP